MEYNHLSDDAKVWIYQADRVLNDQESALANEEVKKFAQSWVSHSNALKATGGLLNNLFLILMVDENQSMASGCSIDSSVRFIKKLGETLNVDFFDRMKFSFLDNENNLSVLPSADFSEAYKKGLINEDTTVFDNLVDTKSSFDSSWKKPLKSSWHYRFV